MKSAFLSVYFKFQQWSDFNFSRDFEVRIFFYIGGISLQWPFRCVFCLQTSYIDKDFQKQLVNGQNHVTISRLAETVSAVTQAAPVSELTFEFVSEMPPWLHMFCLIDRWGRGGVNLCLAFYHRGTFSRTVAAANVLYRLYLGLTFVFHCVPVLVDATPWIVIIERNSLTAQCLHWCQQQWITGQIFTAASSACSTWFRH